jgi:hypothetical protein
MWTLDGSLWTELHPALRPTPVYDGSFTYHAGVGVGLAFGGSDGIEVLGDTWLWDGTSFTKQSPATSPIARMSCSVTYDAARSQIVLFGGRDATGAHFYSDTWTWDSSGWTQKTPSTGPSGRVVHTMAFDAAHGNVVLFGGRDAGTANLNDTWTWDGQTWTEQHPAASPPARFDYGMAYDATRGNVILFGGERQIGDPSPFDDTWMWDGTTWTELHPAHSPEARIVHGFVWDAKNQELVLVSGTDNKQYFQDAWGWNGTDWVKR